jgi:methionyl-tRNA synthetase
VPETFYITTPIYYVNDAPHIGHAYTTVAADVLARYQRLKGRPTWFLTGVDEHGQKVLEAARKRGLTPQQHVDELCEPYKALWARMSITNDDFIRTTEPRHKRVVTEVLQELFDRGEIYRDTYEGWYSVYEERFFTEKDLIDGKDPIGGREVEWIAESNYFFRMSKYADRLRQWVEERPDFVRPESRRNELLGYLKKEVGDLCISRPKSRLPWGIELPFDPDYVTYVWFDALLNYISGVGYREDDARFAAHWPAACQLVGKDILTTHAVYWSTMLFALGLEPADCLYAHGWWTVEGQKMSKSLKNVVDPNLLIDAYGPDPVRYFLLREIPFGADGNFSHGGLLELYNAELANDLGNLAHRALSMTEKWFDGAVPPAGEADPSDAELDALAAKCVADFDAHLEAAAFRDALEAMMVLVRAANKYVNDQAPWALNKQGRTQRLAAVLRNALEVCRIAGALLQPFCPAKGAELLAKVSAGGDLSDLAALARLSGLTAGAPLDVGEPLFPRMTELPAVISEALAAALPPADAAPPEPPKKKAKRSAKKPSGPAEQVAFEEFGRLALRSGVIRAAERHPKADRLLVLKVDIGEDTPRQIVAGIAERFSPEEVVGRSVVVLANLAPASIRGVESQGMVLAAGGAAIEALVTAGEGVPPGTIIR